MMHYEDRVYRECIDWQHNMMKQSSVFGKMGKSVQNKINEKIPQKVHDVLTKSVKQMVKSTLFGSELLQKHEPITELSLEERERRIENKIITYRRTATVEGAGTGFGGLWWGVADFPMLLSIKMKFLYDVADMYGYDVRDYSERLYLLHIFQLAFSSEKKRIDTFLKLKNWQTTVQSYPSIESLDWQEFQLEYRDYIDLAKLLQLIPGFGAIVGAVVNYRFLDHIGKTAMNAYRMRLLDS